MPIQCGGLRARLLGGVASLLLAGAAQAGPLDAKPALDEGADASLGAPGIAPEHGMREQAPGVGPKTKPGSGGTKQLAPPPGTKPRPSAGSPPMPKAPGTKGQKDTSSPGPKGFTGQRGRAGGSLGGGTRNPAARKGKPSLGGQEPQHDTTHAPTPVRLKDDVLGRRGWASDSVPPPKKKKPPSRPAGPPKDKPGPKPKPKAKLSSAAQGAVAVPGIDVGGSGSGSPGGPGGGGPGPVHSTVPIDDGSGSGIDPDRPPGGRPGLP